MAGSSGGGVLKAGDPPRGPRPNSYTLRKYRACGSDLAQHGRDRIDQGAAICSRMASLQRGVGMRSGAADGLCERHRSAKRFGNLEAVSGGSGRWP
jgi:hypothetical protein